MRGLNACLVISTISFLVACGNQQQFSVAPAAEEFDQNVTYNNKVDLLWVVDNSQSMSQHQQNISQQFGSFIDQLNAKKIDYHIAITTMDMSPSGARGRFVGSPGVLTASTPNAREIFRQNILIGERGSDVERGLEAVTVALSPERLAAENSGFLRPDAFLAIVFVTNEDDHSGGSVSNYAEALDEIKAAPASTPRLWMANFIGITEPNGTCFTRGDVADPGDRYMDLAAESGGQVAEICSTDVSSALKNVRTRIVERLTEFRLSRAPLVESIRVTVNGQAIPKDSVNGWSYDPNGFVVRFHGTAVPSADAKIRIDYQPLKAN